MNERKYALFGVVGPLVAYFFIGVSIALSPWFSWWSNALSDLGHSVDSNVASLYNFGLLLAGFFIIIYSTKVFKDHASYTSYCLLVSALVLQLVATFDEVYGSLHVIVSILFFCVFGLGLYSLRCGEKICSGFGGVCDWPRFMDIVFGGNL